MDENKVVETLNNLIIEAIDHGGDEGGPYYTNYENLSNAMKEVIKVLDLDSYEVKSLGRWKYQEKSSYLEIRKKEESADERDSN